MNDPKFYKGMQFSTSKGVPYICVVVEPKDSTIPWQALAIRIGNGPLLGASGLGKTEEEAIQNVKKGAETIFQ